MEPVTNDLTRVVIEAMIVTGGVITTWLTLKYKQRKTHYGKHERIDTIYEGYEKLIVQQQHEINRKTEIVDRLEKAVDTLEQELVSAKSLLQETKDELFEARQSNIQLKKELTAIRGSK